MWTGPIRSPSRWPRARAVLLLAAAIATASVAAAGGETAEKDRRKGIDRFRKGQKAAQKQEWDQALLYFQEAVAVDPHQVEAQHGIGLIYLATRRYAEAVPALELCREKYLELAALAQLASAREDARRDEELVDLQNQMSSINTGRATKSTTLPSVTATEQRIDNAKRLQQRAVEGIRPPARLSLELGVAHHRLGELEAAEREIREAIATDPKLGDAHASLAAIALQSGRPALAAEELELAERCRFKVNPTFKADVKAALAAEAAKAAPGSPVASSPPRE